MPTRSARKALFAAVVLLTLAMPFERAVDATAEDFGFLQPWFRPTRDESERLTRRGVVVRALEAADRQIAIIAVCAVDMTPDAFLERILKSPDGNREEPTGGRLGTPPSPRDLAPLTLDDGDIDRLRRCRRGDCRLNLSSDEIDAMRGAAAKGSGSANAMQEVFRRVITERARRYQQGGLSSLPAYDDRSRAAQPAAIFAEILQQAGYLRQHLPRIEAYLRQFPSTDVRPLASFLHWSKVTMNGKAVVRVTHVSAFRPDAAPHLPAVLLTGKQVYASRYMNGELTLTMLFSGTGGRRYLVHVDRSELDELTGLFSGLKRSMMEGRIKDEAAVAMGAMRDRLERPGPRR